MIGRRFAAMTLLATGLLLSGCSGSASPGGAADAVVKIRDLQFTPNTVTVDVGDTVAWEFDDEGLYHHVQARDGSFDSEIVGEGSFSVAFTEPGTYSYSCSIHPYMTGTIIVSD